MPDFAAWERELAELVDAHFTPGARTGAEGALTRQARPRPGAERVVERGGAPHPRRRADGLPRRQPSRTTSPTAWRPPTTDGASTKIVRTLRRRRTPR